VNANPAPPFSAALSDHPLVRAVSLLFVTLIAWPQLTEKLDTLSRLFATLTRFLTPKSFPCHSYEKHGECGYPSRMPTPAAQPTKPNKPAPKGLPCCPSALSATQERPQAHFLQASTHTFRHHRGGYLRRPALHQFLFLPTSPRPFSGPPALAGVIRAAVRPTAPGIRFACGINQKYRYYWGIWMGLLGHAATAAEGQRMGGCA
jgi:hypothetical protein